MNALSMYALMLKPCRMAMGRRNAVRYFSNGFQFSRMNWNVTVNFSPKSRRLYSTIPGSLIVSINTFFW